MTKVMIVGDTHADAQFVSNIHRCARDQDVDIIVQLGDFGYSFDRNMLESIKAWLDRDPNHQWYWLDGNHDQHDYIEQTILADGYVPYPVPHFHERLHYCPRGSTAQIGNKLCMFLGGAYSIDKAYRTQYVSWWPQEMIRQTDVHRALENAEGRKIDVMFTHDCPKSDFMDKWLKDAGYKVDHNSNANREALSYVVDSVRPDELYHGHFHYRYDSLHVSPEGWETKVHGVGANLHPLTFQHDSRAVYGDNYIVVDW